MVALVVSLIYRQITGLSEAARVLKEEGLLWVKPYAMKTPTNKAEILKEMREESQQNQN